jgi:hypothetical protein
VTAMEAPTPQGVGKAVGTEQTHCEFALYAG